ncbi:hypothetical protein [Candidatus Reidiella endopervernicosa]|uniref:Uncharacterized protein n=1 Tax=Candidatus Reidiella endopervernicosa TaxID=2738883 RepID=A0A6N0HY24_9GAMM|nr:hypothetical protein [Candidatus Reidiella endopervernicosa]QKQ27106.1 hypothetical protein HUE57_13035 [Candidatus Reidiella endopervernicosa]
MTTQIVHEAEYSRQHARFRIPAKLIMGGNPYEIEEWSVSGLSAIKIPQEIGASTRSRYFCESLSLHQPKQTAKLHATVYAWRSTICVRCVITSSRLYTTPSVTLRRHKAVLHLLRRSLAPTTIGNGVDSRD